MKTDVTVRNGRRIAVVTAEGVLLENEQDALELMAAAQYENGCERIVLYKEAVAEAFFVLSTRLAGGILQKFANYRMKLAIVGDYSRYTSVPLRDFILESNAGGAVFFVCTLEEALDKLSRAE